MFIFENSGRDSHEMASRLFGVSGTHGCSFRDTRLSSLNGLRAINKSDAILCWNRQMLSPSMRSECGPPHSEVSGCNRYLDAVSEHHIPAGDAPNQLRHLSVLHFGL